MTTPPPPASPPLSLSDANALRLLLRGESVVDWHRLDVTSVAESRRLLANNGFDWDDLADRDRLAALRHQGIEYLSSTLGIVLARDLAETLPFVELPLVASGSRGSPRLQRDACTLLKVVHILHHLRAADLRTRIALSEADLHGRAEKRVLTLFEELRTLGAPISEFHWSRKSVESMVTKMLLKREANSAQIFDRLRFRFIVDERADLLPVLQTLIHRLIPFNYVVPGQSVNGLVDIAALSATGPSRLTADAGAVIEPNAFSGTRYRAINFVADLPVRVDDLVSPAELGAVVFVAVEFQLVDRQSAEINENGDSAHDRYKARQHAHVVERLLREPTAEPKPG